MRNGSLICVNAARHPPRATSPDDALARGKKVGMSRFTSHIVLPDQVRTVYPLVREAVPGLELRTWVAYARKLTNPRSAPREGIVAVRRVPRPMPCGLFLYRRENDLGYGTILATEYFIAMDVLDTAPVMRALAEEMDMLASRLGCAAIRALVRDHTHAVHAGLAEAGLRQEGAMLWKRVATTPTVAG
jgi:hypothetical protein